MYLYWKSCSLGTAFHVEMESSRAVHVVKDRKVCRAERHLFSFGNTTIFPRLEPRRSTPIGRRMNHLHICQTCRQQARLHTQLRFLREARRGLFRVTAPARESGIKTWRPDGFTGGLPQFRLRAEDEAADEPLRRYPGGRRISSQQHRDNTAVPPARGRYSGEPLQPIELLTRLAQPEPRLESRPERQQPGQRDDVERTSHAPYLPIRVARLVDEFIACGSAGERDERAWSLLQTIAELQDYAEGAPAPGQHTWFVKAYVGFTMRCCRRLTRQLHSTPSPSQALNLLPVFQVEATNLWARVTWQVSSALVELRAGGATESAQMALRDLAIKELMILWRMCLASGLRRSGLRRFEQEPVVPGDNPDWSILPDPLAFARSITQRQDRKRSLTLKHTLELLMPPIGRHQSNSWGRQTGFRRINPADLRSAALVTLDTLRQTAKVDKYRPFVHLLEEILKVVNTPETPPALNFKLETVEDARVRAEYMGVVERLRLRPATPRPPMQTSRSTKPSSPTDVPPSGKEPLSGTPSPVDEQQQHINAARQTPDLLAPPSTSLPSKARRVDQETDHFVTLRIDRLGQAIQKQNLGLAEYVKEEVLTFAADSKKPSLPNELYEHVMLALLSLRSPHSAIQVWNHFVKLGRPPTAKTYTVMMRGAQHVRDVRGVEAFWHKMRDAGVQPDVHAWSIRVFGLIRAGRVADGIKALTEMGREWFNAARAQHEAETRGPRQRGKQAAPDVSLTELVNAFKDEVNGVPRPTLEVMNSAVSALASVDDSQISKVLSWGRPFGLEPDRVTYNVLLNIAMRHGEGDSAVAFLKRMQERGLDADSTTWTVLLSALFEGRSLDGLSAEDQEEKILRFMRSLEIGAAASIDEKGYALIIDRLLKYYSNPAAASAVLRQMTDRGITPTAHIFTILMSSYFQQQPQPDFAAVEALLSHIQALNGGRGAALDSYFFDRMIEGYATHHWIVGTEPMLRYLNSMTDTGKKPSWRALDLVARALADRQDWNRLLQIVDHARRMMRDESEGEYMVGGQKRYGQIGFWHFIISTGLLEQEGIRTVDQIMGDRGEGGVLERAERRAAEVNANGTRGR